jgi:hypothetical protein
MLPGPGAMALCLLRRAPGRRLIRCGVAGGVLLSGVAVSGAIASVALASVVAGGALATGAAAAGTIALCRAAKRSRDQS